MDPVADATPAVALAEALAEAPPAVAPTDALAEALAEGLPATAAPRETLATPAPSVDVPNATVVSAEEVTALVARARAAQPAWGARPVEDRVRAIAKIRDRILDRAELIGREVHRETGKPEIEAVVGECLPSADVVDYWTRTIDELLVATEIDLDRVVYPDKSGWTFRDPRGTVALITPWSYPIAVPLRTLVPALLAGNTVVWKPSEVAPGSASLVAELFSGLLPEGVLEVAYGGPEVGRALACSDVDLVVFQGGVAAGREVARACAERVSPCSLELGGKDAAIVLADANLERAANGIVWAALSNAGQNAAAVERVYVVSSVADAFVARVKAAVEVLRPGVDIGPMTTEARRGAVAEQVAAAVAEGGELVSGGATSERFIAPVVVRVPSDGSSLMQEQTFGPVIPIAVVADVEEAITRANASKYGLTASLWSKDIDRAEALARRLRAGVVTINNHAFTAALPAAPWGGHGQTGSGLTSSPLALDTLTRPRFVLTDRSRAKRELWWYPYTPGLRQMARSAALARSRTTGLLGRVSALLALVGAYFKRFKT